MSNEVLVIGLGNVGEHILELLARSSKIAKITGADIDEDMGLRKVCRARYGAALQGFYPRIEFTKIDLNNVEETTDVLKGINPDVIVNTATIQSWWVIAQELPEEVFKKLDAAGYGPWLPFHLMLTHKLMKAFKKAKISAHVISSPFPDAVNPVLGKVGLAPTVGLGNIDLMIPGIEKVVADKFKVPMHNVSTFMIAAHFLNDSLATYGTTGGAPYFLKILIGDKNVTDKLDSEKLLVEAHRYYPKGRDDSIITASSAVKNILAILDDTGILTHAPGPAGLPGGYPVRLSSRGAEVVLPEEITLEEAIRINEEGLKCDGIERIKDDGTVVFTEKSADIMREMLEYDCRKLKLMECEERAKRLRLLYKRFAEKHRKR